MAVFGALKIGMMSYLLPILFFVSLALKSEAMTYYRGGLAHCVPIQEPLCRGNYNFTTMPNILGHETQKEASGRYREFLPLIKSKCSKQLQFFLCSLHFPMCNPQVPVGIPACRAMCEHVRTKCEPYMRAFNFEWPETLDCSKIPEHTERIRRCMHPDAEEEDGEEEPEGSEVQPNAEDDVTIDDNDDVIRDTGKRGQRKPGHKGRRKDRRESKTPQKTESHVVVTKEPTSLVTMETPSDEVDVVDPIPSSEVEDSQHEMELDDDWMKHDPASHQEEEDSQEEEVWIPTGIDKKPIFTETDSASSDDDEDDFFDFPNDLDVDYGIPDRESRFLPTNDDTLSVSPCRNPDKFIYMERMEKCLPICDVTIDVMFSSSDKRFAYFWMLACSILCIVSSALTVGTFLVDSKRFRYPERPIIFLSLCYLLYSSAYLVRLGSGPSGNVSCVRKDDSDVTHVVMGDLESTGCTAVFFLLYYFGMAAAVWWVILSITWFLAAGLKWGHEAIEAHGFYFHLVAWLLPAIQTIVVLVMGKVDGDELTGLCYVGNLDPESLLYFVIVPLTSYLAVGALALGCGFGSLLKIRRVILSKSGEKGAGKLEKLMLKIGIFTVLYIVPTACVVAVHVYQYKNHSAWVTQAERVPCNPSSFGPHLPYGRYNRNAPHSPPKSDYFFQDGPLTDADYYTDDIRIRYPGYYYEARFRPLPQFIPSSPTGEQAPRVPYDTQHGKPYGGGSFRQDSAFNVQRDVNGKSEIYTSEDPDAYDSGTFYTGRRLYRVPSYLNPGQEWYYRHNPRERPMPYSHQIARAFQRYATGTGDPIEMTANPQTEEKLEIERDCHLADSIPSFPIFAIKILMSLLAGITSGIWVWSGKTYKSWKKFCRSCWCGSDEKEKGVVANSNHANITSSGNLNTTPSVTSHTHFKTNNRLGTGGIYAPTNRLDDRYSFPMSDDLINKQKTAVSYTSSMEQRRPQASLTLGDLAREFSNKSDGEFRETAEHDKFLKDYDVECQRNKTYIVTPQLEDSKPAGNEKGKMKKSWFKRPSQDIPRSNKKKKKELNCLKSKNEKAKVKQGHATRDNIKWLGSQSNRAIPNSYEIVPTNRGRAMAREANGNTQQNSEIYARKPNIEKRTRKFSENDLSSLPHVSHTGFSPVSTSTRKKAQSVNIGIMTSV